MFFFAETALTNAIPALTDAMLDIPRIQNGTSGPSLVLLGYDLTQGNTNSGSRSKDNNKSVHDAGNKNTKTAHTSIEDNPQHVSIHVPRAFTCKCRVCNGQYVEEIE